MELGFTGAGSLAPGQTSGHLVGSVTSCAYESGVEVCDDHNELDDFSYLGVTALTANTHATAYVDGVLVWGEEPGGALMPFCANGAVDSASEECDDGNTVNTDACVGSCQDAACGDGYLWTGVEECDDGNTSNNDACVGSCQEAACGDGYLRTGVEVCDPGIESGCLADCSGYVPTGCTTLAACFGIEHMSSGSVSDNNIAPYFRLRNNGTTSVNLSQVRIRYWFSAEATSPSFATNCYWAALLQGSSTNRCNIVSRSITAVATPTTNASHYLDVTFGAAAGSLAPGQSTGDIQLALNKSDWCDRYSRGAPPRDRPRRRRGRQASASKSPLGPGARARSPWELRRQNRQSCSQ